MKNLLIYLSIITLFALGKSGNVQAQIERGVINKADFLGNWIGTNASGQNIEIMFNSDMTCFYKVDGVNSYTIVEYRIKYMDNQAIPSSPFELFLISSGASAVAQNQVAANINPDSEVTPVYPNPSTYKGTIAILSTGTAVTKISLNVDFDGGVFPPEPSTMITFTKQ